MLHERSASLDTAGSRGTPCSGGGAPPLVLLPPSRCPPVPSPSPYTKTPAQDNRNPRTAGSPVATRREGRRRQGGKGPLPLVQVSSAGEPTQDAPDQRCLPLVLQRRPAQTTRGRAPRRILEPPHAGPPYRRPVGLSGSASHETSQSSKCSIEPVRRAGFVAGWVRRRCRGCGGRDNR